MKKSLSLTALFFGILAIQSTILVANSGAANGGQIKVRGYTTSPEGNKELMFDLFSKKI